MKATSEIIQTPPFTDEETDPEKGIDLSKVTQVIRSRVGLQACATTLTQRAFDMLPYLIMGKGEEQREEGIGNGVPELFVAA